MLSPRLTFVGVHAIRGITVHSTFEGTIRATTESIAPMLMLARPSIFVYGTFMAPEVLKVLIGRVPESMDPAILTNYVRHPVKNEVFPGMIPSNNDDETHGLLLQGLSERDVSRLDWFEGDEYVHQKVQVIVGAAGEQTAQCYVWSNPLSELDLEQAWDYDTFRTTKLDWYLSTTVRPCRIAMDELGIGLE